MAASVLGRTEQSSPEPSGAPSGEGLEGEGARQATMAVAGMTLCWQERPRFFGFRSSR
jgi:hypothetical protein